MKYVLLAFAMLLLPGCIGTEILEPDVDVEEPFSALHTVPKRPEPKDFPKLREEWKELKKHNKPNT